MSEVKVTPCPFCADELFRTTRIENWPMGNKDTPPIQHDADGLFVCCPHCQSRVQMVEIPTPEGSPSLFGVKPGQRP